MLAIIILVCLTMVMFLWLLALLGAAGVGVGMSGWLAWFACLFLALAVYLVHYGVAAPPK